MILSKRNDQFCRALNLEADLPTWIQEWNRTTITKIVIIRLTEKNNHNSAPSRYAFYDGRRNYIQGA